MSMNTYILVVSCNAIPHGNVNRPQLRGCHDRARLQVPFERAPHITKAQAIGSGSV